MEIKVELETAENKADMVDFQLRKILFLATGAKIKDTYYNQEYNKIIWIIEGRFRSIAAVQRNVIMFDKVIQRILKSSIVQGLCKGEDKPRLQEMFKDTKIKIIKRDDPRFDNKSWLDEIKEKWKKKN